MSDENNSTHTIRLHKIKITQDQLANFPEDERILFVQLGIFMNELTGLTRIFRYCGNESPYEVDDASKLASVAQAYLVARMLIGKLNEGWELLTSSFFSGPHSEIYQQKLSSEAADSLRELRRYFGRSNPIRDVRRKVSFHYDRTAIAEAVLDKNGIIGDLFMYLADDHVNSYYHFADNYGQYAVMRLIDSSDPQAAMNTLMDDTINTIKCFYNVVNDLLFIQVTEYIGKTIDDLEVEELTVKGADVEYVYIPPFAR